MAPGDAGLSDRTTAACPGQVGRKNRKEEGEAILSNVPRIKHATPDALLAEIVASSDDAIASKTLEGIVTSWNGAAERLFGYAAEEMIGRPIAVLAAPGREDEMPAILARIRSGERVDHLETVRRRKDGGLVEIALTVSPVRDRHGRIVGASKIARDIGARRTLEERQRLLFDELRHRVKNLLALVQALARQTEAAGRSGEAYRDAFLGRLGTLVRAHELAFEPDATANLGELVTGTLAPYQAAGPARLAVELGPSVVLARGQVTPLCLILHELATNAVKHGALSSPAGQVRVGWQNSQDTVGGGGRRLRLRWTEQGGPETRPPAGQGFGTRLVEFAVTHEMHGQAELTFTPQGLQAEIAFPIG
jgi:PAS domain S-box-containing protein